MSRNAYEPLSQNGGENDQADQHREKEAVGKNSVDVSNDTEVRLFEKSLGNVNPSEEKPEDQQRTRAPFKR